MITVKNVKYWRTKADRVFSLYIRQRFAKDGVVSCYTCGKILLWKDSDCGHYIGRQFLGLRYSEDNCRPQCRSCNRFQEGNKGIFRKKLILEYGESKVLIMENKIYSHIGAFELEQIYKHFSEKLKEF